MPAQHYIACILAALALAPGAVAQTVYDGTANSSVHVETVKNESGDAVVAMRAQNARFVPYLVFDGDTRLPRLLTVTTDVKTRGDAEGADPTSTVAVTVDDLTSSPPRRLAAFSDRGSEGALIGQNYFSSTSYGCCDEPDVHAVRLLDAGRALFVSTGPGAMGSTAWAEVPNARPAIVRWAAFNGQTAGEEYRRGMLGTISYGSDAGAVSAFRVFSKLAEDARADLWEGLAHGAVLVWIDPKATRDTGGPSSGTADSPKDIWALKNVSDAARIGGFQLALMLDGKRLALIPVAGDRLDAAHAVLSPKISALAPVP